MHIALGSSSPLLLLHMSLHVVVVGAQGGSVKSSQVPLRGAVVPRSLFVGARLCSGSLCLIDAGVDKLFNLIVVVDADVECHGWL